MKKSNAAASIVKWVLAIENYCTEKEQSDGNSPVHQFDETSARYSPARNQKMRASKNSTMKKPKAEAAPAQQENIIHEVGPDAINGITKAAITELKSFKNPPRASIPILEALCIMLNMPKDPGAVLQKELLNLLSHYDKDDFSPEILAQVRKYTRSANFNPQLVAKGSMAMGAIAAWVIAVDQYCILSPQPLQEVDPQTVDEELKALSLKD